MGQHATAPQSHATAAQLPLGLNAAFSLANGIVLTLVPSTVSEWLGVSVDGWLRLFGIGLLLHGLALAAVARSADPPKWARLNLVAIAPYPLLMLGLLVTQIIDTGTGRALVAADGAIMAAITLLHWRAVRPAAPSPQIRRAST